MLESLSFLFKLSYLPDFLSFKYFLNSGVFYNLFNSICVKDFLSILNYSGVIFLTKVIFYFFYFIYLLLSKMYDICKT